ncbi:alpha/beta hydrolase [Solihabitans fulvus]|uniref:Alpha/beta hydrolase n=1 Tax=Solihabitans fulvus TaxID=1892852 RepID=A0A5B2WTZ8_9PSEU|nr:alpha/beta fold hydrolase [Solihabitans fulvus]KAA2255221.1 alpha/beta hydrolase [Solihabitans fulvus]
MHTLTRPGAELDYDLVGTGPLAVYAHGSLFSRRSEDQLALVDWTAVADAGRRLLRYDARAHGRSTGRPVEADYAFPSLAGDLLALLDHVGADGRVDGIGASMGSGTVLWAATLAPGRFRRLVLTMSPTAWDTRPAQAAGYQAAATFVEQQGKAAWVAAMSTMAPPPVLADVPGFPPEFDVAENLLPALLRGLASSDLPDQETLATLDLPVLVLSWDGDPGHPVSTAEKLAEVLPDAELHVSHDSADVRTWADRAAAFLAA